MTLITLPAFLVPYAFYLNMTVALVALAFYALSVRLIGTRWARWQWDTWRDAPRATSGDDLLHWWFLFPGMAFMGKIGKHYPTRFSWSPSHWFLPMIAIAVTRCHAHPQGLTAWQREHRWQSKRFTLQMQALFWAPSLAWNLAVLGAIVIGTIVWMIVWNGLLGIPRFLIRAVTQTFDRNLTDTPRAAMIRDEP